MKAIADWVFVVVAALAGPALYTEISGLLMAASNLSLSEPRALLSEYTRTGWLYFWVVPLLIPGHAVVWIAVNDTPARFRLATGALAQGAAWAVLAGSVIMLVMQLDATPNGYPQPVSSKVAEMFGVQLALIAALVFAILGAVSGALTGAASREFVSNWRDARE